ncbi:18048_t:CDS:2, partial [Acaulospora morrowiae]
MHILIGQRNYAAALTPRQSIGHKGNDESGLFKQLLSNCARTRKGSRNRKKYERSILRLERLNSLRGALEYVRSQISLKNRSIIPIDEMLTKLSNDKVFTDYLQK